MKTKAELAEQRETAAREYNTAAEAVQTAVKAIDDAAEATSDDEYKSLNAAVKAASEAAEEKKTALDQAEAAVAEHDSLERARGQHKPVAVADQKRTIAVDEPDMYTKRGRSFMVDLYRAQLKNDHAAAERIGKHQQLELERYFGDLGVEERATVTGTLGGLIPPQYLVNLLAKAARNGRVFADQANHQTLPDTGMSLIIPRLTTGLAAAPQATEGNPVATQDPVEVDLSVPIRTIAGYAPVSRQTIERAAYSDSILFEDLVARYYAQLDTQAINGAGTAGTMLGTLNTSGIATSSSATATAVAIWPKIADVIQQINGNVGGLGYVADKIFMHPRRWGFFSAAVDSSNRPLYQPMASAAYPSPQSFANGGEAAVYGFTGALIHGLPVYTDANIPTNLGAGTNEDRIIVEASGVVHLWERDGDPITLSFEQQAGTSLQVQLICYGYCAFTAGRYPGASGVVSGASLVPPTF